MRWRWQIAPCEQGPKPRILVLSAPLVLVSAFSIAVKSADSSGDFKIDKTLALRALKRRIEQSSVQSQVNTSVAEAPATAELREVREVVRKGDTLGSILRRLGINDSEVSRWSSTSRRYASLSRLQPDHAFTFLLPTGTDRLAGLQYEISPEALLVMREEAEEITAQVERLPRMVEVRVVSGVIDGNLYTSASKRGVPESVISTIVDVFSWEIDFATDLQPGDTFRVAFEDRRAGSGDPLAEARVLAAELGVKGKLWKAVYFESDDDGGNYYSPEGLPFGRAFLRYPVEFTRISSSFTSSRFHPVLGVKRPHRGVDFAAPIGTPIRAIAAGRVLYAGWNGGSGRYARIDHGSGLESSYSHMSSISRDVRAGVRVQVGQVIGTVGASGLATGPHLHFAFFRSGIYVNPMTVKLSASPSLAPRFMREFAKIRDELLQQLAVAPIDSEPTRLASTRALSRAN